jgi:hypothetical protein
MSAEHGASYSFNRQWTAITSVKNHLTGEKYKWVFRCGCGHESEYTSKRFPDPYEAARTALEYHVCEPAPDLTAAEGIANVLKAKT